jgi:cytochrome c peroxidase
MSRNESVSLPLAIALLLCAMLAGTAGPPESRGEDYQWVLPKGLPKPHVPANNPMSAAKVELGRYLFYDQRMSVNGTVSCATCHKQELAFTDGRAVAIGATGELHSRGAMSLVNVAYSAVLTWSNPQLRALEDQALVPMFGEHPVELGLRQGDGFLPKLRSDARYQALFASAFPQSEPFTIPNVTRALASFERSIVSANPPMTAITTAATRARYPTPPSVARFCSSASRFRASAAMADSISVTPPILRGMSVGKWNSTIPGYTTLRGNSLTRCRT